MSFNRIAGQIVDHALVFGRGMTDTERRNNRFSIPEPTTTGQMLTGNVTIAGSSQMRGTYTWREDNGNRRLDTEAEKQTATFSLLYTPQSGRSLNPQADNKASEMYEIDCGPQSHNNSYESVAFNTQNLNIGRISLPDPRYISGLNVYRTRALNAQQSEFNTFRQQLLDKLN
jgi:hypothetical protein